MIIGTIGSFASGACFPLLLFVYQQVTDALVNYGKLQYIEQMSLQNLSQLSCENGGYVFILVISHPATISIEY